MHIVAKVDKDWQLGNVRHFRFGITQLQMSFAMIHQLVHVGFTANHEDNQRAFAVRVAANHLASRPAIRALSNLAACESLGRAKRQFGH